MENFIAKKSFFRMVGVLALCLFAFLFVYAYILETRNNGIPEGLKAPFVENMGKAQGLNDNSNQSKSIEPQHLSSREISKLLNEVIAESLTFDKDNFEKNTGAVKGYFTQAGYAQYQEFLRSTGLKDMIEGQDLQSGVYLENAPLEISSGVFNGAYKWLFEVSVNINFVKKNAQTMGSVSKQSFIRKAKLRIQMTRVFDSANPDLVQIEIWQMTGAP